MLVNEQNYWINANRDLTFGQVDNQSNVVRTHDDFYVHLDPDAPPKDTFVQVGNLTDCYVEVNNGLHQ